MEIESRGRCEVGFRVCPWVFIGAVCRVHVISGGSVLAFLYLVHNMPQLHIYMQLLVVPWEVIYLLAVKALLLQETLSKCRQRVPRPRFQLVSTAFSKLYSFV